MNSLKSLTPELIYIILDLSGYGVGALPLNIGNNNFYHVYSKLYRMNDKTLNFRELWGILQTIDLNVDNITYYGVIYPVTNGCIDIPFMMSKEKLLEMLLWRVGDEGSQPGDKEIIIGIFNNFITPRQATQIILMTCNNFMFFTFISIFLLSK